jgi:hypothetical protein
MGEARKSHPFVLSLSKHERSAKPKPSGVARQQVTFSCFAKKKVTKVKATPVYRTCGVPCVARLVRRLRNSHDPLRGHVLKQSSPTSPDQPALLGGAQGKKN